MLTEAGLPSIENRKEVLTARLAPKICDSHKSPIIDDAVKILRRKKVPKCPSTIFIALNYAKSAGLSTDVRPASIESYPPWLLPSYAVNTKLSKTKKDATPKETYSQLFKETMSKYCTNLWDRLYTDGSKSESGTGYAVVSANGEVLCSERIPNYFSTFSTEALAIFKATELAKTSRKNSIICTDSLSTVNAIRNIRNRSTFINKIRDNIIQGRTKLIILWIPGHSGIRGNELADRVARSVSTEPNIIPYSPPKNDSTRHINSHLEQKRKQSWAQYTHLYRNFNSDGDPARYPTTTSSRSNKCFLRLRLGHTQMTHSYILQKENPPTCHLCQSDRILTIKHFIYDCPKVLDLSNKLFKQKLSDLLIAPSVHNINAVFDILKELNLDNNI